MAHSEVELEEVELESECDECGHLGWCVWDYVSASECDE
jgi:hypothetical protein